MSSAVPSRPSRSSLPQGIDASVPNVARIYDYFLSGKDNFAADRDIAEKIMAAAPSVREHVRTNREFLGRVVRYLVAEAGVRQFLDIGAGLPTQANVHETAARLDRDVRVVYVDYDPVVCVHARALLGETDRVGVVQADLRDPEAIFEDEITRSVLDLSRPVAVLMVAILHFIPDADDPYGVIARYRDALPPGSHLALSHGNRGETDEGRRRAARVREVYSGSSASLTQRSRAEVARFFAGFELVEPGLVALPDWRPEPDTTRPEAAEAGFYGGVGRVAR